MIENFAEEMNISTEIYDTLAAVPADNANLMALRQAFEADPQTLFGTIYDTGQELYSPAA